LQAYAGGRLLGPVQALWQAQEKVQLSCFCLAIPPHFSFSFQFSGFFFFEKIHVFVDAHLLTHAQESPSLFLWSHPSFFRELHECIASQLPSLAGLTATHVDDMFRFVPFFLLFFFSVAVLFGLVLFSFVSSFYVSLTD
jgi:hypothetical protein